MKGTGYPLHSPVSPSLPLPCFTVWHHISTGVYKQFCFYGVSAYFRGNGLPVARPFARRGCQPQAQPQRGGPECQPWCATSLQTSLTWVTRPAARLQSTWPGASQLRHLAEHTLAQTTLDARLLTTYYINRILRLVIKDLEKITFCTCCILRCLVCIVVVVLCVLLLVVVCIVVVVLCVLLLVALCVLL